MHCSSTFVVRPARPDEHARLGQLMVAVYASLDGFPGPADQPRYYDLLAGIGALADPPAVELLVAADGDALLGGVVDVADVARYGAGGILAGERDASAFRLLAVDRAARGRGVGKALAVACVERARRRGHAQVVIHTTEAMRVAWAMYERLGFARAPALDFLQEGLPVFGFRLRLGEVARGPSPTPA